MSDPSVDLCLSFLCSDAKEKKKPEGRHFDRHLDVSFLPTTSCTYTSCKYIAPLTSQKTNTRTSSLQTQCTDGIPIQNDIVDDRHRSIEPMPPPPLLFETQC